MSKYGGITIGPIVETLGMASRPAELWGASYMFSYLAKRLCLRLLEAGAKSDDFLVPVVETNNSGELQIIYHDGNKKQNATLIMEEGVGLLHDRIIWEINNNKTEEENLQEIACIIAIAKKDLVEAIASQEEEKEEVDSFFEQYLQINGICTEVEGPENSGIEEIENNEKENKGPLLEISDYLDALELQKQTMRKEKTNYVLKYLDNQRVKKVSYFPNTDEFSLVEWVMEEGKKTRQIKKIEDICKVDRNGYKTERYFAIVQADGDNMGTALTKMKKKNQIRQFSMMCVKMAVTGYKLIKEYGGYLIYAGGDDLLFLAPLMNQRHDKSLLSLLGELGNNFKKLAETEMKDIKLDSVPTLSFGVSIQYERYPLYEAFGQSRKMLFQYAKRASKEKDTVAIFCQKHSGQSLEIMLKGFSTMSYRAELEEFFKGEVEEELMRSVYRLLNLHGAAFQLAIENEDKKQLKAFFKNIFDNIGQKSGNAYIEKVHKLAQAIGEDKSVSMDWQGYIKFLKLVQFYFERGER